MLSVIVDKNGAAFSEEVAEREQSEHRHLADKAREQLIAVNAEPDGRHATYLQGYRDALNELSRMRPVLQPCVHAVTLKRVCCTDPFTKASHKLGEPTTCWMLWNQMSA
jgi:hypothetical protein